MNWFDVLDYHQQQNYVTVSKNNWKMNLMKWNFVLPEKLFMKNFTTTETLKKLNNCFVYLSHISNIPVCYFKWIKDIYWNMLLLLLQMLKINFVCVISKYSCSVLQCKNGKNYVLRTCVSHPTFCFRFQNIHSPVAQTIANS